MKKISWMLTVSLMIVTLVVGLTLGYFFSPDYQQTMYDKTAMDLGPADRRVDLSYINQMAAHHTGAILLADQLEGKTSRPELQALIKDIQTGEPKLIAQLYDWKKAWYQDPRPAKNPQVAQLGGSDDKIDLRFLNALIAHHQTGIAMAQEIRTKSSRSEVLNDADAVEKFLSDSLVTLRTWRQDWYGIK